MKSISRRTFLGTATLAALQPRFAIGQAGESANAKLNIALTTSPLDEKLSFALRLLSLCGGCITNIICVTLKCGGTKCPLTLSDSQMKSHTGSR